VSAVEISGILLTSFLLNIIPFAGPSNLLIASTIALRFTDVDPLMIGFLVALGAASAKFIHYLVMFFAGRYVGEKRLKRIDAASPMLRKWAPIALFVAAATPIPDEPVIVPLGLIRYNPGKFFVAYFLGKLLVGFAGAYFGVFTHHVLGSMINENILIVISIALTVIVTVIFLKVDVSKLAERIFKRKITHR
jgi:membrane protein DedA with SNARE-associated domain